MRIAIDISQLAFSNTGVANYLQHLVLEMVKNDSNDYVLFFSSMRRELPETIKAVSKLQNVTIKRIKIPPSGLHFLWNILHKVPIETFVGTVDLVISSDWTEPPVRNAKKAAILYDMIVYKYPEETHPKTEFRISKLRVAPNIVSVQIKKHYWMKKESDIIFCISEATRRDANEILGIDSKKLRVVYPGFI